MRQAGLEAKCGPVLAECDRLRDEVLPTIGVRLEDRDGRTCMKLADPETIKRLVFFYFFNVFCVFSGFSVFRHNLLRILPRRHSLPMLRTFYVDLCGHYFVAIFFREQEQAAQLKAAKDAEKAKKQADLEAKEAARRIPPSEMFRSQTDKYSAFDDRGMPTHDVTGEPISKKQLKKLEKLYETQEAKYAKACGDGGS